MILLSNKIDFHVNNIIKGKETCYLMIKGIFHSMIEKSNKIDSKYKKDK